MNKREKKERLSAVIERLKELYPEAKCSLEYEGDAWRLLVMGRLSAQCTDARVNIVCKELFAKYPNPEALSNAKVEDVEKIIKPCGLYHMKTKDIINASRELTELYGGRLPDSMDGLLKLSGVGRKIANMLLGDIYHLPAVVCDTHCIRICGRLGMYPEKEKNPLKIEKILKELIEGDEGSDFCHRLVLFGRDVCMARGPLCEECSLSDLCEKRRRDTK